MNIVVSPSAVCSAKAFVPSKSTLLWAYSDDDYIDVGNCMSLAGTRPIYSWVSNERNSKTEIEYYE